MKDLQWVWSCQVFFCGGRKQMLIHLFLTGWQVLNYLGAPPKTYTRFPRLMWILETSWRCFCQEHQSGFFVLGTWWSHRDGPHFHNTDIFCLAKLASSCSRHLRTTHSFRFSVEWVGFWSVEITQTPSAQCTTSRLWVEFEWNGEYVQLLLIYCLIGIGEKVSDAWSKP